MPSETPIESDAERLVVLLVDDQAIVAEAIRRMLGDVPHLEFHHCADVASALPTAHKVGPTVILQDLVMPDVDGFTMVSVFGADPRTSDIPIIVLSSKDDPRDKGRAFELGATDYLVKIPSKIELVARIRAHSRSHLARRERDAAFKELAALKAQLEATNVELQRLSVQDALTGLFNRRRLDEVLNNEWRRCQRERVALSVVLCDVDYFKRFNDAYGHQAGDTCLQRVAEVFAATPQRPADLAARYGGEEFALVLPNTPQAGALFVAGKLCSGVEALGIVHAGSDVARHVTLSAGVCGFVPDSQRTAADLLAGADAALYMAKGEGRNRVCGTP